MKKIIILIIIIIILLIIGLITILPIYNDGDIFNFIKSEYNTNPIFSTNKKYPIEGGWDSVSKESINQQLVLSRFDVFSPIYTIIIENPDTEYFGFEGFYEIRVVELRRVGINTFEVSKEEYAEIRNSGRDEVIEAAKSGIITRQVNTDFDIVIFKELSEEEIQRNLELFESNLESDQNSSNEQLEIDMIEKRLSLLPPEGKERIDLLISEAYFGDSSVSESTRIEAANLWLDENYPETKLEE
jgi:hypothetical protein